GGVGEGWVAFGEGWVAMARGGCRWRGVGGFGEGWPGVASRERMGSGLVHAELEATWLFV
ncbi:MAG: hypothetical protein ACK55I_11305, partial [bacterium]